MWDSCYFNTLIIKIEYHINHHLKRINKFKLTDKINIIFSKEKENLFCCYSYKKGTSRLNTSSLKYA